MASSHASRGRGGGRAVRGANPAAASSHRSGSGSGSGGGGGRGGGGRGGGGRGKGGRRSGGSRTSNSGGGAQSISQQRPKGASGSPRESGSDSGGSTASTASRSSSSRRALKPTYEELDLSQLQFQGLVGAGRFGSVYKALWKGHVVAVKKTLCFEKEAQLLASLSHKHIVQFYGACTQAPNSFLVTEYAPNGSLFKFLEDFTVDYERIIQWAQDIAKGLRYLHHETPVKIIHRDLKSLNVLVSAEYDLKICDFGSSRTLGCESKASTFAGTVAWMAPEVIRNERVTEKCDLWSYGVLLWELLTQEMPYGDMDGFAVTWLVAKHGMKLHIPDDCPHAYAQLMLRCMQTKPEDRPDFCEVMRMLERIAQDEEMHEQMVLFLASKASWQQEIDAIVTSYRQLEQDHSRLADKSAELERREKIVQQREQALETQLHCMSMHSAAPASPRTRMASSSSISSPSATSATALNPANLWSEQQVASWVSVLPEGLSEYAKTFLHHNINGKRLLRLDHSKLKEGLEIKSFGHREGLLEQIGNIQKSTDFPPLPRTADKGRGGDAARIEENVTLQFQFQHLPEVNQWMLTVSTLSERNYVQNVNFVLTKTNTSMTEVEAVSKEPFVFSGRYEADADLQIACAVTYNPQWFRRKTTKRNMRVKCSSYTTRVKVKLQTKHAFPRPPLSLANGQAAAEPQQLSDDVFVASPPTPRGPAFGNPDDFPAL